MTENEKHLFLVRDLPIRTQRALKKEISEYGERAYRRGVQQAVAMKVTEYTAFALRNASINNVHEICDTENSEFKLVKRTIDYRFQPELEQPEDEILAVVS